MHRKAGARKNVNIFGKNKKNIVRPKRRKKGIRKKMFDEEAAWPAKNSCLHFITINNIKLCPLLFLRCVAFLTLSQSAQLSTSFSTSRLHGTLDSSLYAAEGKLSDFQFIPNPQKPFTAVVCLPLQSKVEYLSHAIASTAFSFSIHCSLLSCVKIDSSQSWRKCFITRKSQTRISCWKRKWEKIVAFSLRVQIFSSLLFWLFSFTLIFRPLRE